MAKPELKVEDYLVAGTKARGGMCPKVSDRGRRGCPDRECKFPNAIFIHVETKAKDGVLKPWQKDYHTDLRALGYTVLVLWTRPQVDLFFAAYDRGTYG
jgi:hypothetical protein